MFCIKELICRESSTVVEGGGQKTVGEYCVSRIAYCVSVIGLPGYQEVIIRISGYQGDPFLIPCCADFLSPLYPFLLIIGYWLLVNLDPRLRHSGTGLAGLFGVYLLIRKRAVLRYIDRPPQGKGQATGGLCLLSVKHMVILT